MDAPHFGRRATPPPAASPLTDEELSARGKELFRQVRAEDAANLSEDEKRRKREEAEERREALCDVAIEGVDLALSVARSRSAGAGPAPRPCPTEARPSPSGEEAGFLSGSLDPGAGLGDAVTGIVGSVGEACGAVGGVVGDVVGGVVSGIGDLLP
jgi:hypothetical protein